MIIAYNYILTYLVQEKMNLYVIHVIVTFMYTVVIKNCVCKMEITEALGSNAEAKFNAMMRFIGKVFYFGKFGSLKR